MNRPDILVCAQRASAQVHRALAKIAEGDPLAGEVLLRAACASLANLGVLLAEKPERPAPLLSLVDEETPEVDLDECPACLGMRPLGDD